MNKHAREWHGTGAALDRRRSQQSERLAAVRSVAPLVEHEQARGIVFVTCPRHRDALWKLSRGELLRIKFGAPYIRRRFGIMWSDYEQLQKDPCVRGVPDQRLPKGLKRNTFLHYDFHIYFLPKLLQTFERDPSLKWGAWVEDDVVFKPQCTAMQLGASAITSSPSAVWVGYILRHGLPTWGSHCLVMTKAAATRLLAELDEMAEAVSGCTGRELSYLVGLDTWFKMCLPKIVNGAALMVAPPVAVAHQRAHLLRGRR